jgi:GR25 family glycosyltransferase involved in LPS biosynthesis
MSKKCPKTPKKFFLSRADQALLYDIVEDTFAILKAYKIKGWACEGTLLGAIRHEGLVPWDDDIDIGIRLQDRQKIQDIPDSAWQKYNLALARHWLGFKIYRPDGKYVPNTKKWPYKYPFVDVFIWAQYGDRWMLSRAPEADWEEKAADFWGQEYFLHKDLFPLTTHKFDFPEGSRKIPVPKHSINFLNHTYKGWDQYAYTNAWDHRKEKAESLICKYDMSVVREAEREAEKSNQDTKEKPARQKTSMAMKMSKASGHHKTKLKADANVRFFRKYIDHIYIINLAHREDRRQHIHKQMMALGIPTSKYSFVKATDRSWESQRAAFLELGFATEQLPQEGYLSKLKSDKPKIRNVIDTKATIYRRIASRNRDMRNKGLAEAAVTLSHARIWHHIMKHGEANTRCLVLEDDACVAREFEKTDLKFLIEKAAKEYPQRDLVLFGYCWPDNTKKLLQGPHNSLEYGSYYCMHSYVMTPDLCKLFLSKLFPITDAVDNLFNDRTIISRMLVFKDPVFYQSEESGTKSDIQLEADIQYEASSNQQKFGKCIG